MVTHIVDTFEHDIANEIRHKEASIEDIAASSANKKNSEENPQSSNTVFFGAIAILVLCGIVGAGYAGYLYSTGGLSPKPVVQAIPVIKKIPVGQSISSISETLNQAIGPFRPYQACAAFGILTG